MNRTVLCIGFAPDSDRHTMDSLQVNGIDVLSASDFKSLESLCSAGTFNLAVVSDQIPRKVKLAIAALLAERRPHVPIVELYHSQAEIGGAYAVPMDSPQELLHLIHKLLEEDGRKHA
ncbi:MAG TPA: hypothetical protein VFI72_08440 [Candidatus Angelobacter sp.]|nr:hypothetical protein [Candidatus Angelobacter sp.]